MTRNKMPGWQSEVCLMNVFRRPNSNFNYVRAQVLNTFEFFNSGKVYNVTEFIDKHPGGVSTISKGIGKDGTSLFESVNVKALRNFSWNTFDTLN